MHSITVGGNVMESYTSGSSEFISAIIEKGRKAPFTLSLNAHDFRFLVLLLERTSYDGHTYITKLQAGWADDMLSYIAESLGIEGI